MPAPSPFPGITIPVIASLPAGYNYRNPNAHNLLTSFRNLPKTPSLNAVNQLSPMAQGIYTAIPVGTAFDNHFQGIQRLNNGTHFIISAGNKHNQIGNLIVKEMKDYQKAYSNLSMPLKGKCLRGPIGSNVVTTASPPTSDTQNQLYKLEEGDFWHAGGISTMGDLLLVPMEDSKNEQSKIVMVDASDPDNLKLLQNPIPIPKRNCGAVSGIKLKNGQFLFITWTDSGTMKKHPRFHLFHSTGNRITSEFRESQNIRYDHIRNRPFDTCPKFQAINLIENKNGEIFIIGCCRYRGKTDQAWLFRLTLKSLDRQNIKVKIEYVDKVSMAENDRKYYEFSSSAGAYIDTDGNLSIYGGHLYRRREKKKNILKFAEFSATPLPKANPIQNIEEAWVELYNKNWKKVLKIHGTQNHSIQNYNKLINEPGGFGNTVAKAKYVIPQGWTYYLYKKTNFGTSKPAISLTGTGFLEIANPIPNHNLSILSSRYRKTNEGP